MLASFRRLFSYKIFPVCWTVLIIVLLCLPGSMVPGNGIFGLPNFDKAVHLTLFAAHTLLWGWQFSFTVTDSNRYRQIVLIDVLITILLGIALEYVQKYWIPNRSFDVNDILADAAGAVLGGIWLVVRAAKKTK